MSERSRHPLEYGLPIPWHLRERSRRGVVLLLVGAAIVIAALSSLEAVKSRLMLLRSERDCSNLVGPSGSVVFSDGLDRASVRPPPNAAATAFIEGWKFEFFFLLRANAITFAKRMRSGKGEDRTVIIAANYFSDESCIGPAEHYGCQFLVATFPEVHLLGRLRREQIRTLYATVRVPAAARGFLMRAPQPDPLDPSHFLFAYETTEGDGIVDAFLQDDGTVKLGLREAQAPGRWVIHGDKGEWIDVPRGSAIPSGRQPS